jgi:IclR family transcriptional regulator, mhp operon transcriptional activator
MPKTSTDASLARGVLRTLATLRALNERGEATVSELSRGTQIPRPSLYRILDTLGSAGYVRKREERDVYELTPLVRSLSEGFRDETWVRELARPIMLALQQDIVWPTDLSTFFGNAMYLRETTRPRSPLTIDTVSPGMRLPMLHSATGRAYLAFCSDEERRIIVETLARSSAPDDAGARDKRFVAQLVASTRRAGYGTKVGEWLPKIGSIALPVFARSRIVCCLNITFIASALTSSDAATRYLPKLRAAAAELGGKLEKAI